MNYVSTFFRSALLFLVTLIALQSIQAGLPPLIRRKVLFNDVDRTDAQVSPDGRKLSSLAKLNGVVNLWVRTVGTFADSAFTNETKYDVQSYTWAQDGKRIAYARLMDDGSTHIFVTSGSSAPAKDLTPFDGANATIVGTNPLFPSEVLLAIDREKHGHADAYRVNIETGKSDRVGKNSGDIIHWYADNAFKVRAALAVGDDGTYTLRSRKDEDSRWTDVCHWALRDGEPQIWGFNADNSGLFAGDARESNTRRAVEISLTNGSSRIIASDSVYDAGEILTSPIDHHVQAVFFNRERLTWNLIDTSLTRDSLFLGYMDGDNTIVSRDNNDSLWVVRSDRDVWPVRYVLYNHKKRNSNIQFAERPSLEKYLLTTRNPISFTTSDGATLHGYLTLPNGLDPDTASMVVVVHNAPLGGPWARDSWGFDATTQWLANRGYAVLQLNFRGSTGYGKSVLDAADKNWSGIIQRDIVEGVRWVLSQGFIDSTRIAIWGEGFGGYTSLIALSRDHSPFLCGVDISGMVDLAAYASAPKFSVPSANALLQARVGDPSKEGSLLKSNSPINFVERISLPVLIAQGGLDPLTPQKVTDEFVASLKAKNPAVQYILFPDESAGLSKQENRLKFYEAAEEFLGKYLKGRTE